MRNVEKMKCFRSENISNDVSGLGYGLHLDPNTVKKLEMKGKATVDDARFNGEMCEPSGLA